MSRAQMQRRIVIALVCFGLAPAIALAAGNQWIEGANLGQLNRGLAKAELHAQAEKIASGLYGAAPGTLRAERSKVDQLGQLHVRLRQTVNGKPVFGADSILHADAAGRVYLLNGRFADAQGVASKPALAADAALASALRDLRISNFTLLGKAETAYAVGIASGRVHLAWRALVEYGSDRIARDYVYADAATGKLVAVDPTIHYAKSWRTHDANKAAWNSPRLPGTLLCTNTQSCGDADAQNAHDGASETYDYYQTKFGRDSLNNGGMTLISSVNVGRNWNNAAWIGTQMVYGKGDGVNFSPLAGDLDVIGHELTHGVTDFESDLVYANASGALNEAWSDIFGAAVEAWSEGGISADTWKIGEDIYTPGIAGDALRYMDNPTLDGYSTDYYPERIPFTSSPSSSNDNGGVHGNSGIANLAFYLLVEGGSHPRGKTSTAVAGIGLAKAEQIFYRANTVYFTSSTDFQGAADGTAQSALDLDGDGSDRASVLDAWCAVGVGTSCGGGGGNGVPVASFTVDCPSLTCNFTDTSTDSDGSIVSWSWNFGDGATSTAADPSHTYAAAGTYSVSLSVTDNEGATDGAAQNVNVSSGGSDTTPPVISNVSSAKTGGPNFVITWTTNEAANSVVSIAGQTFTDAALVTSHSMSFRGSKNATYSYSVSSTDAAGNTSTAGPFTHQN